MSTSKNADKKAEQRAAKVANVTATRDAHEALLAGHDNHCGRPRVSGRPLSRVESYRKAVGGV